MFAVLLCQIKGKDIVWASSQHFYRELRLIHERIHIGTSQSIYDNDLLFWHRETQKDFYVVISVFLTHVAIRQMPTWLPTWKAKSLYHVGTFLTTWFFLPLQKFKTIKIKLEKNPLPKQIRTYNISQGIILQGILRYFQIYMLSSLANCKQLSKWNRLYQSLLPAIFFFNRY